MITLLIIALLIIGGIVVARLLWARVDAWLFGQWTETYDTVAREEAHMSIWDRIFGGGEPADGTTRELPEPQTAEGCQPATATHEIYQGGRWVPAAGEQYADGREDIIPVLQWVDEEV